MRIVKPKALIVGERPTHGSQLADRVHEKGCECTFAASYDEACSFLKNERFDFVFSPMRLQGVTSFPLMDLLEGSEATLFYFHAVEDGFWCLPALHQGQRCFGSSGLTASEFVSRLDELIEVVQRGRHPANTGVPEHSTAVVSKGPARPAESSPPNSAHDAVDPVKQKAGD